MTKDLFDECMPLDEVKAQLMTGAKLRLDLDETACLWKKVAEMYVNGRGGSVARVTATSYRSKDNNTLGMDFDLWVKVMRGLYNIEFVTFNSPKKGILYTDKLRVSGGKWIVRGTVESIAREMFAKPNQNLEMVAGLKEDTLRVDINDRRSIVWLETKI